VPILGTRTAKHGDGFYFLYHDVIALQGLKAAKVAI
jgi:hypothetical protein